MCCLSTQIALSSLLPHGPECPTATSDMVLLPFLWTQTKILTLVILNLYWKWRGKTADGHEGGTCYHIRCMNEALVFDTDCNCITQTDKQWKRPVEIHAGIISFVSWFLALFISFLYTFRICISLRTVSKSCLIIAALAKSNILPSRVVTENLVRNNIVRNLCKTSFVEFFTPKFSKII
jgi:hypothetical protein